MNFASGLNLLDKWCCLLLNLSWGKRLGWHTITFRSQGVFIHNHKLKDWNNSKEHAARHASCGGTTFRDLGTNIFLSKKNCPLPTPVLLLCKYVEISTLSTKQCWRRLFCYIYSEITICELKLFSGFFSWVLHLLNMFFFAICTRDPTRDEGSTGKVHKDKESIIYSNSSIILVAVSIDPEFMLLFIYSQSVKHPF